MAFEKGPLSGRFYSLKEPRRIWRPVPAGTLEQRASLCRDSPPHDSDLEASTEPLSYASDGPAVAWIRVDERSPSKTEIEALLSGRFGDRLKTMRRHDAEREKSTAREEILTRTTPRTKIVQAVVVGETAWISGSDPPETSMAVLTEALGPMRRWLSYEPIGFQVLARIAARDGLSGELQVDKIAAKIGKGKVSGPLATIGSALEAAMREGDVIFESLSVSTGLGGSIASVTLDPEGPSRISIPDSTGGLPAERIERRMEDALEVASRVHRDLQARAAAAKKK